MLTRPALAHLARPHPAEDIRSVQEAVAMQRVADADQELPWGAGADQEPHDQAEIVAGDVHEVALV